MQRCCYTVDDSLKPTESVYVSRNFQSRTFGPAFDLGASSPAQTSLNSGKTKDIMLENVLLKSESQCLWAQRVYTVFHMNLYQMI